MSSVKKSLEENKDEILKNLPEEFHADFHTAMANAEETVPLTPEEELEAIKAELTANPDVDHDALIPLLESSPTAHRADPPPSAEEQDSAKAEALAKVGELVAPQD